MRSKSRPRNLTRVTVTKRRRVLSRIQVVGSRLSREPPNGGTAWLVEAFKSFGGVVSAFAQVGVYQTILGEGGAEIGTLLATFQENAERTGSSQELMSGVSKLMAA
jgi:hypothetical protein